MWRSLSGWYRLVVVIAVCALAGTASGMDAWASIYPPTDPDEVWYILEDETVSLTGDVTVLNLIVLTGHLNLTDCILRLGRTLEIRYGGVTATNTWFTTAPDTAKATVGGSGGVNSFVGCTFDPVGVAFGGYSQNTFENCTLRRGTSASGVVYEYSENTFTNCTIQGFNFWGLSTSTLDHCSFPVWDPDVPSGRAHLAVQYGTTAVLADFAAGDHVTNTVSRANGDGFLVRFIDTAISGIAFGVYDTSSLMATNSTIRHLGVWAHAQVDLADCHLGKLNVHQADDTGFGPVNVLVRWFSDAGDPQNVSITSDNTPFRVSFVNTDIFGTRYGRSTIMLGDGAGPGGSTNLIEDSTVSRVYVYQNSFVEVRRSTLSDYGGIAAAGLDQTARFVAEDSQLRNLWLDGESTEAVLRRTTVSDGVFLSAAYGMSAPSLTFEAGSIGPQIWAYPGFRVYAGVQGARILGDVTIGPDQYVREWASGSTIIRSFPVLVKRPDGQPVVGAAVQVPHPPDPCIWSGVTDADGFAYPEVTFDDTNYGTEFTVTAAQGGASESAPLTFLASTPINLVLPVIYQLQWVPPLHDGTTVESPDGPFKCGRTLPVKFRLLDAQGQVIPDEEAQGLVAQLNVFYEEPSGQGDPIDPGDNPPDMGDQFRYDAEDDLFIFNLSTKDSDWLPDYTYGLQVLIDGIKAGDVYFSLR